MTQINHDGFARTALHRETITCDRQTCNNCGGHRWRKGAQLFVLFSYYTVRDDSLRGRKDYHKGLFCSKSCHDAYHS
jgi:hypothetical protein